MSSRWIQLGTLTLLLAPGTWALAQTPKTERDGGLTPPIVQVIAKEPIEEEEIVVEVIKVMPKTREQMKIKGDGEYKTIKIKREKTDEPISMIGDVPTSSPESSNKVIKARKDEPLNFLPAEKQKAVSTHMPVIQEKAPPPALLQEERPAKIVKVPVREPAYGDVFTTPITIPDWFTSSTHSTVDWCEPSMPSLSQSNVGWIDTALIGTQARLRYDARWRNPTPDRAEFYTARNKQYFDGTDISGRGFEVPERNIDLFEGAGYFEWAFTQRFSVFGEMPIRYIRPTENPSAIGVSDINFGFKLAYFVMPEQVQTFQLRMVFPTASDGKGLGTGHTVIEPSLLLWQKLAERWTLESEFRNWIPVGGTNHAGYTLRYAMGISYDLYDSDSLSLKPVAEVIGWSTLRGYQSEFIDVLPTFQSTGDARGTVIESAWGLRGTVWGNCDWYTGYSFALTDTTWFKHNMRMELRWRF